MCISKILVNVASPLPKFEESERFLFVSPHPDDIEIGAGATVARLCEMGKEVYYVIVTNGKLGARDCKKSCEEIIKIRIEETKRSAKLLGVKDVIFLDFDDGGMYTQEEISLELAKVYAKIKPDIVFAPDPRLPTECHFDHIKTGFAAGNACIICDNPLTLQKYDLEPTKVKGLAMYYTVNPNYYFGTKKCIKKQIKALSCYESQFEGDINNIKTEFGALALYIKIRSKRNGLKKLKCNAEAFRVFSPLMFHCCTERV